MLDSETKRHSHRQTNGNAASCGQKGGVVVGGGNIAERTMLKNYKVDTD